MTTKIITNYGQKVYNVDTLANLKLEGLISTVKIVFCEETETLYKYEPSGALLVANDQDIVITVDGGDTRWVGIAGRFSYYPTSIETEINVIQDKTNINYFSQPHAVCYIPTTNQIFVGCRSNYIFVFGEDDLSTVVFNQNIGKAINTCCYDATQDKVYFTSLTDIWEYDPQTVSATNLSVPIALGASPSIASDGAYIYGVSYTNPAVFFKVDISNPTAAPVTTTWTNGDSGHACVLHKYTSKTELYCTATNSNVSGGKSQFAAVDCDTMSILVDIPIPSYQATDDIAYQNINDTYGYCYATPEDNHIGTKIKTDDGTYTEFYSPYSYGSFTDNSHLYIADLFSDSIYKYPNFELDKYEVYTFHPTFEQQKLEFDLVPASGSFVINFTNNMLLTVNATDSADNIQANLTCLRSGVTDFYTITGNFVDGFIITFNGLIGDISNITIQDNTLLDGLGSGVTVTVSEVTKGVYNRKPNELIITPNGRMFYTSFITPCHIGEISLGKWEYIVQPYSIIEGEGINNNSPYSFIQGVKNINKAQNAVLIGNYIYNKGNNVFIMENLEYPLTGTPITTAYKNNIESNIAKFFGVNRITAAGLLYYSRDSEQTFGSTIANAPIDIKPNIPMEMFLQDTYYASIIENTTTPGIYDDGDSLSYNIYPYYESSTEGQVFGNPYGLSIVFSSGVSNCSMDINDVTLVAANPLQLAPTGYRFVRLYNGTTSIVDIAYASPINLNDNGTDVGGTAWITISEADAISPAVGTGCTESTFGVPGVSSFANLAVGISMGVGSSRSHLRGSVSTKIRNIYKSEIIAPDDHVVNLMSAGLTLELTTVDSSRDRHYYINNISTGNATVIPSVGSTDTFTGGETSLVLRPNTSVHIVAQYAGGAEDKWRIVFNTSELASLVDLDLIQKTVITKIQELTGVILAPHAVCWANGYIFVGTRSTAKIYLFNAADLTSYTEASESASIESACYDTVSGLVYYTTGNNIKSVDPTDISTVTTVSSAYTLGNGPAICTDGIYIYGVTCVTTPVFFKIEIANPSNTSAVNWTNGNQGHACKLHIYSTKTEMYCTSVFSKIDGYKSQFAVVNCADLSYVDIPLMTDMATDDFAYQNIDDNYGYCYIGCETGNTGTRIKTDDLSLTEFFSPSTYCVATDGIDLYITDINTNAIYRYPKFDITKYEVYVFENIFPTQTIDFEGKTPISGAFKIEFADGYKTDYIGYASSLSSIQGLIDAARVGVTNTYTVTGSFQTGLQLVQNGVIFSYTTISITDNTLEDGSGAINVTVTEDVEGNEDFAPNELVFAPTGEIYYTSWVHSNLGQITLTKTTSAKTPYTTTMGEQIQNNRPFCHIQGSNIYNFGKNAFLFGNFLWNEGDNVFIMEKTDYPFMEGMFRQNLASNVARFFGTTALSEAGMLCYPRSSEIQWGQGGQDALIDVKYLPKPKQVIVPGNIGLTENSSTAGAYNGGDTIYYKVVGYRVSATEGKYFCASPYDVNITIDVASSNVSVDFEITDDDILYLPWCQQPQYWRILRSLDGVNYTDYSDVEYTAGTTTFNDDGSGSFWNLDTKCAITPTSSVEETFGSPVINALGDVSVGNSSIKDSRTNLYGSISTKTREIDEDSSMIAADDHVIEIINSNLTIQLTPVETSRFRHYIISNTSSGISTIMCDPATTDIFEDGSTFIDMQPNTTIHLFGKPDALTTINKWRIIVNSNTVKAVDDTATASANKVGTLRYRATANNSYCEMCMQTGASTYDWIAISTQTW